jgi:hypothetical protein
MGDLLQKMLDSVRTLTLSNVLVIALLVVIAIPAYIGWRVLNDPVLMGVVFSQYREYPTKGECALIFAQPAGGTGFFAITNAFAERNNEFWSVAVRIKFHPDDEAIDKYCGTLAALIEYARDPNIEPAPTFPGSSREMFPHARPSGRADQP